jgi:hypothetical protein
MHWYEAFNPALADVACTIPPSWTPLLLHGMIIDVDLFMSN